MPRPSRCLDPAKAPQTIHFAPVGDDTAAVADELIAAVKNSVTAERVVDTVNDINALIGRVEQCMAVDPDDVVPVASYDYLWELRLDDQASGVHIRIYVAEVNDYPHTLIALHAHAKFVGGTAADIKQRQNEATSLAAMRFKAGEKSRWGMP